MKKLTTWFALAAMLFALNLTILKADTTNEYVSLDPVNTEQTLITSAESSQSILSIPEADLAMVSSSETVESVYADALIDRLNEINEMDMSNMDSSEKKELKKEVRAIEKQQRDGIYISVGAAILIGILLILLL